MTQKAPRQSKFKSWATGLLVGIPLVFALVGVALFTVNLRILVNPLLAQSERLIGRAIHIGGGIYLDAWPHLSVRATELEVFNTDWGAAPRLATVASARLALDLSSVRRDVVRVRAVEIDGATLNLERNEDGIGNWSFDLPAEGREEAGAAKNILIDKLSVADSHVSYRDADAHTVELEVHQLALSIPDVDALGLDAQLSDETGAITVLARLGPVSDETDQNVWPLRLEAETAYGAAKIDGAAPAPWDWMNVAGAFSVESHNLPLVENLLGVALPQVGDVVVRGELNAASEHIKFSELAVEAGTSSAEGQITFDWSTEIPTLSGSVSSRRVALEELLAFSNEGEPVSSAATVAVAETLDRALRAVNAQLALSASQITGLESTLEDASLSARTEGGTLTVRNATATVGKRRLDANARLWVDGTAMRVEGNAKAPNSSANTALRIDVADKTVAISGEAAGDTVDVDEIVSLVDAFLPEEFEGDGDVDVTLNLDARIRHAISKRAEARDASCEIGYASGELRITNAKLRTGPTTLSGATTLVFGERGPEVSAIVDADAIVLGQTLPKVLVTEGWRGRVKGVSIQGNAAAESWSKLLEGADLEANAASASLRYQDGPEPRSIPPLSGIRITSSPQHGLEVSTSATVNDAPVQVSVATLVLHELLDGKPMLPLKGSAQVGGTRIDAAGELRRLKEDLGAQFKVDVQSDNTDGLEQLLGVPLAVRVPITASTRLTAWPGRLELADIRYASAGSHGTGGLTLSRVGDRPTVKLMLDFDRVEMPDILKVEESAEQALAETEPESQPAADAAERLLPDIQFHADQLRGFDADVRVDIREATVGERVLGQLGLTARLEQGVLELERLHGTYAGSSVEVDGSLDVRAAVPDFRASGALVGIDYGEALRARGVSRVSGKIDLGWDVYGQGNDLRELVSTLDGTVGFVGGEGVLPNRLLQIWGGSVLRLLWVGTWVESEDTKLNCIVTRWDLKDGVATTDALLVDTADMTIAGSGVVDLNSEQLEIVLKPAPKDPSLFRVSNPVRISGPLAGPSVGLTESGTFATLGKFAVGLTSPAVLVLLFSDVGAGHENRCAVAIEEQDARKALKSKDKTRRPVRDFIDGLFGVK
ncbi:MAG: hypothetical protein AMS22_03060 [Thiotrichales bacterium SG8_50]|nr:MAG: hypothetical protein AMS22_03060 [Thiotrichales bacterium SG8_50]